MKKTITYLRIALLLFTIFISNSSRAQFWRTMLENDSTNFFQVCHYADSLFNTMPDSIQQKNQFKQYSRMRSFWMDRTDAIGDRTRIQKELNSFVYATSGNSFVGGLLDHADWKSLGPLQTPQGSQGTPSNKGIGRLMSFWLEERNTQIIYAGSTGGLYRSIDGGVNWQKLDFYYQNGTGTGVNTYNAVPIQYILVDSKGNDNVNDDVVYIATGWDMYFSDKALFGFGVLKSTDGGQTFNPTGLSFQYNSTTKWQSNPTITKMVFNPDNKNIIYAISSYSDKCKVYKTTDGGQTWPALSYDFTKSELIDLEITKNSNNQYHVIYVSGNRLYRSDNEGATWNNITTNNINTSPVALIKDPDFDQFNPSPFAVNIWSYSPNSWLKYTQSGNAFAEITPAANPSITSTLGQFLAMQSINSGELYSCQILAQIPTNTVVELHAIDLSGSTDDILYNSSTSSSNTFQFTANHFYDYIKVVIYGNSSYTGITPVRIDKVDIQHIVTHTPILIDVDKNNPNVLYTASESESIGSSVEVYKSTDYGTTSSGVITNSNAFHSSSIKLNSKKNGFEVSNISGNEYFYFGEIYIQRKTTSTSSSMVSPVHVDLRQTELLTVGTTDILYVAQDGGLSVNNDARQGFAYTNFTDLNGHGLDVAQVFGLCSSPDGKQLFYGAQDCGVVYGDIKNVSWTHQYDVGGDGGNCMYSQSDNIAYVENFSFGGTVNFKARDLGTMSLVTGKSFSPPTNGGIFAATYPIEIDKNSDIYAGAQQLYKKGTGNTWTQLSSFTSGSGWRIVDIEIPESNSDIIYVAKEEPYYSTASARLFKFVKSGATYAATNIGLNSSGAIQTGYLPITDIELNPADQDILWITKAGFEPNEKVYKSTNGGVSFTALGTTGLPNFPIHCIKLDRGSSNERLFIGTEVGVYYTNNDLQASTSPINWLPFNKNMGTVLVKELEILDEIGVIRAATFGAGIWESPLPCIEKSTVPYTLESNSNTTWDKVKIINSDVVVSNGATLEIKNTLIRFGDNTQLIVEPGGKLIIDNAILTKSCQKMWAGITVKGKGQSGSVWSAQGTYALPSIGSGNQGLVIMKNNARIAYAIKGISVGTYGNNDGGGIVFADGSHIRNCRQGVVFYPYENSTSSKRYNISYFNNCKFSCTEALPEPYGPAAGVGVLEHLIVFGTPGVRIHGCTFENTALKDELHGGCTTCGGRGGRGTGIQCLHGSVYVTPGLPPTLTSFPPSKLEPCSPPTVTSSNKTTFYNLDYGITSFNTYTKSNLKVLECDFKNCTKGIYTEYDLEDLFWNNTFVIDDNYYPFNGIGWNLPFNNDIAHITIKESNAYKIYQNTFSQLNHMPHYPPMTSTPYTTYGTYTNHSERPNTNPSIQPWVANTISEIKNNAFSTNRLSTNTWPWMYNCANYFSGKNTDVKVEWNTYSAMSMDWHLNMNPGSGEILGAQAVYSAIDNDPMNTFSTQSISTAPFNIDNLYEQNPGALTYLCYSGANFRTNLQTQLSSRYHNTVNTVTQVNTSANNIYCNIDLGMPQELVKPDPKAGTIEKLNRMQPGIGLKNELITVESAQQTIPTEQQLREIERYAKTMTEDGEYARNYLRLQGYAVENATDVNSGKQVKNTHAETLQNRFLLYPNPTPGKFYLNYEIMQDNIDAQLKIYDILGNLIFVKDIDKSTGTLEIDLEGYVSSVYQVQICAENIQLWRSKILIVN